MTQPIIDDTHVDLPDSQQPLPPSPADMAPRQQPAPPQQPQSAPGDDADGDGGGDKLETIDDYKAALEKARKESAKRRVKLRELEPLAQQAREAEEAQKSEVQKAVERAEAAEKRDRDREENFNRLDVAVKLGIDPDNIDLIGPGSREEMEARAARVKAMQDAQAAPSNTPPPSDRPVEGLRPGASPEPPNAADDSYPESWKPSHVKRREDERRSQYGQ